MLAIFYIVTTPLQDTLVFRGFPVLVADPWSPGTRR
jgi:hypothetical protein